MGHSRIRERLSKPRAPLLKSHHKENLLRTRGQSERNGEGGVGGTGKPRNNPMRCRNLLSPVVQLCHGGAGLPNQLS
jgi:hypothetical protein